MQNTESLETRLALLSKEELIERCTNQQKMIKRMRDVVDSFDDKIAWNTYTTNYLLQNGYNEDVQDYKPDNLNWSEIAGIRESAYTLLDLITLDFDGYTTPKGLRNLLDEIRQTTVEALLCIPSIDYYSYVDKETSSNEEDNNSNRKSSYVISINSFDVPMIPSSSYFISSDEYGVTDGMEEEECHFKYESWYNTQKWEMFLNYIDVIENGEDKSSNIAIWNKISLKENVRDNRSSEQDIIEFSGMSEEELYKKIAIDDYIVGLKVIEYIDKNYPKCCGYSELNNAQAIMHIINEAMSIFSSRYAVRLYRQWNSEELAESFESTKTE